VVREVSLKGRLRNVKRRLEYKLHNESSTAAAVQLL